ncbi:peroxisomal biogenesis factor 19 [Heterodontus francisci]|uniref:peroxisomal biogenesis factor 19 n=1 Tax=Heterodontus francisci TaxID=7792 RepID=UPI00355C0705
MLKLNKTLVQPQLEYCIQFWAPDLRKCMRALGRIQERFTRMVPGMRNFIYEDRLENTLTGWRPTATRYPGSRCSDTNGSTRSWARSARSSRRKRPESPRGSSRSALRPSWDLMQQLQDLGEPPKELADVPPGLNFDLDGVNLPENAALGGDQCAVM